MRLIEDTGPVMLSSFHHRFAAAALVAAAALSPSPAFTQAPSLAPYVPSPTDVVDRMLAFAKVTASDVVYDLGSGDGRIVIAAAKQYGARGVGVDIDPELVAQATENAKKAGVDRLVSFKVEDAMTTDVSPATVVTLYLFTTSNVKLRRMLTSTLKPGARIVSHTFSMGDWAPSETMRFQDSNRYWRDLYLWRADGKVRP